MLEQTVQAMESLLVSTGVYNPEKDDNKHKEDDVYHGHRDIEHEPELAKPTKKVKDVYQGLQHILKQENFSVKTWTIHNDTMTNGLENPQQTERCYAVPLFWESE